jgi:glyoxylate reductase
MKPRIFLTRSLPDSVKVEIEKHFNLDWNPKDRPLSKREIIQGVKKADGLIAMLNDVIDKDVIHAAPNLKIIANYAVGYNNIDLEAASERGIVVTNTPGVLTETTADLTWALILSSARRIPEADSFVRTGKWTGWAPTQMLGSDVYGKTLGIIGMGRIGKAVARRAAGFSMKVIYYSRHRLPIEEEKLLSVRYCSLQELLSESDFISLHTPLTEETRHLMDQKALHQMKPTAFLINTARGPIVDEKALIRALKERRIAGAAFDVYEEEPRVPMNLRKMKQVVLLPHIGSASRETRIRMGLMVLENLLAFFSGKKPPNQIN